MNIARARNVKALSMPPAKLNCLFVSEKSLRAARPSTASSSGLKSRSKYVVEMSFTLFDVPKSPMRSARSAPSNSAASRLHGAQQRARLKSPSCNKAASAQAISVISIALAEIVPSVRASEVPVQNALGIAYANRDRPMGNAWRCWAKARQWRACISECFARLALVMAAKRQRGMSCINAGMRDARALALNGNG